MKKTKAKAAIKKPASKPVVIKKAAPRKVARPSSQSKPAVASNLQQGALLAALTDLVAVSIENRELLVQIRDALLESEEAESAEVDTIVIAETEPPEPSEDEF